MQLNILKINFSESIVRKSLYWLSEDATWTMSNEKEKFVINLTPKENKTESDIEAKLHQLLNDFYLRNELDNNNKHLRIKIIEQALKKVYMHNA